MASTCSPSAIRRALADILASRQFSNSPQMSSFLQYVVEESIAGNQERIKAYTIAVDALGKSEDFDGQKDPSVRVLAVRLRTCLASYNRENEADVLISIPRGGYRPVFKSALERAAVEEDPSESNVHNASLAGEMPAAREARATVVNNGVDSSPGTTGQIATETSTPASTPEAADTEIGASSVPTAGVASAPETDKAASTLSTSLARDAAVGISYPFHERRRNRRKPGIAGNVFVRVLSAGMLLTIAYVGYHVIAVKHVENAIVSASTTSSQPAVVSTGGDAAGSTPLSTDSKKTPRARPSVPTVHINDFGLIAPFRQVVTSQTISGMANSGRVNIIRESQVSKMTNTWPEDYELLIENSTADDQGKVTFQLRHFNSGQIVYAATVSLALNGSGSPSADSLEGIQTFAARLVHLVGPVINDYLQRGSARPALACLFRQQARRSLANDLPDERNAGQAEARERQEVAEECLAGLAFTDTRRNDSLTSLILQAGILLDVARGAETDEARAAPLANARKLVEQAVSLSPFRADVHALLMETLHMSGDLQRAETHGSLAYQLNRFDSEFLREYAELLDELDRPADSKSLRDMAELLDR